jgi:mRNA interferase RelE/StbE
MPANLSALIRSKIDAYAADPATLGNNVTKLVGRDGFRLRVGDWRVIFDDDGAVIAVLKIGPRGGVYD